mmetsp:Transcript_11034/g.41200  ORF Transcript_11034/g.41200 Transcript_11034/m.41200 type:complete len:286 (-) Transcript_11034:37-894(-)
MTKRGSEAEQEGFASDGKYRNKKRVLVLSSRGITARYRHLVEDLRKLLPHQKKDSKFDAKGDLSAINEIADVKSCNFCLYFEARKRQDLYMWVSKQPTGPSVKFHVSNVHTMDELKLTGNCMLGSRPLLSFDAAFDVRPETKLMKELLSEIFSTPRGHPKSKPFVDRIMSFFFLDGKIWIRNYQITDASDEGRLEKRAERQNEELTTLTEIGPRFVLTPIRVFGSAFGGRTIYSNSAFVSPNAIRSESNKRHGERYSERVQAKQDLKRRKLDHALPRDELQDVFK